eukprot:TRINITY_DN6383_c0_g1_i4.p1 TRINITY_DN6383_c0_g1~~TRINITY_DN6383_c0_g1_i4.p1  ORF type:complete len:583 (+),score=210.75 TRINITY_DN6383_c0_g1_i4:168-1751(+)
MDGNNQLVRLRVGTDGKISLERRILSIPSINLSSIVSVPKRVLEAGKDKIQEVRKEAQGRAQRKWRKAVTGDPEKRIRDHMKEVPQVKMIDKLSFTFGVLCICGSEWLALRHADWFPLYYYAIMTMLLVWRLIAYSKDKYQLFMLDFCYFVNLSVILQTAFFPTNINWFKANYILCMGPLMFAIIVWKNSLVFHSLDKLTSFFLHAFPPLTVHLFRWGLIPNPAIRHDDHLAPVEVLLLPLGLYLCWQLGYWTFTEGLLRSQLANDQDLITSIRYLASDKKNGFRNLCLSLLCWLGLNHPGEELVADSVKTKITFAVTQLVYTLITIIPTPFLFSSYRLSCVYMVLLYGFGTWNGASYYIEVFAERYRLQFARSCQEGREDGSSVADTDTEEESDEYENALEEVEIDQSSELYKTIVAAIIEDDQALENEMDDDEFDQDIDNPPPAEKTEKINKDIEDVGEVSSIVQSESNVKADITIDTAESAVDDVDNVHALLEEAAGDDIKRSSNSSSESNGQSWEELDVAGGK